nr:protein NYNRIN-like [Tanacetum cinerariifolium]
AKEAFRKMKKLMEILPTFTASVKGRIAQWAIRLGKHDIEFKGLDCVEKQIPNDFLTEMPFKEDDKIKTGKIESKKEGPKLENMWKLYTDGASSSDGLGPPQAKSIIKEIHEGSCKFNAEPYSMVVKVMKQGPLAIASGSLKFLAIAVKHFTKWVEAKPLTTVSGRQAEKFVWEYVICRPKPAKHKDKLFKGYMPPLKPNYHQHGDLQLARGGDCGLETKAVASVTCREGAGGIAAVIKVEKFNIKLVVKMTPPGWRGKGGYLQMAGVGILKLEDI